MRYSQQQYRDIRRRVLKKFQEQEDRIEKILSDGPKNNDDIKLMLTAMGLVLTESQHECLDPHPQKEDNVVYADFNQA